MSLPWLNFRAYLIALFKHHLPVPAAVFLLRPKLIFYHAFSKINQPFLHHECQQCHLRAVQHVLEGTRDQDEYHQLGPSPSTCWGYECQSRVSWSSHPLVTYKPLTRAFRNGWHTSEPTDGCTAPSITSTPLVSGLSESTLSDLARTKDGAWLPPALYRGVW